MIPNVVRGDRMGGLMVYLAGPGRSNEHVEPHLVAGDPALMAWHGEAELGRDSALAVARHLDRPRTAFDVEVTGGHVWHCSLSLRAEEGIRTDQEWAALQAQEAPAGRPAAGTSSTRSRSRRRCGPASWAWATWAGPRRG